MNAPDPFWACHLLAQVRFSWHQKLNKQTTKNGGSPKRSGDVESGNPVGQKAAPWLRKRPRQSQGRSMEAQRRKPGPGGGRAEEYPEA